MGIGSKTTLKQNNVKQNISFDSAHPNRTYLNKTKDTLAGDIVELGDIINVDDYIPVEAKVSSIYRKPNGKTYITGTLRDESVETWMSTIVQKGPLQEAPVQKIPKKGPRIYTAQRGQIRTWNPDDPVSNGGRIKWFSQKQAFIEDSRGSHAINIDQLWSVIPPSKYDRMQGSHGKTWFKGNHVEFGHGPKADIGTIGYFVIGNHPGKPYAVVLLDDTKKLVPVDQLYLHKLDKQAVVKLYPKAPAKPVAPPTTSRTKKELRAKILELQDTQNRSRDHLFAMAKENNELKKVRTENQDLRKENDILEDAVLKLNEYHQEDLARSKSVKPVGQSVKPVGQSVKPVGHPRESAPELVTDHELSCPLPHRSDDATGMERMVQGDPRILQIL